MTRYPQTSNDRVLFVIHATATGGMEAFCVDLAAEFKRRGVDVAVTLPESIAFDALSCRFRTAGLRVVRLDTDHHGSRLAQLTRLFRFARFIRYWRPNVVHLHIGGPAGGTAVVAATRLTSAATVVVMEHDGPADPPNRYHRLMRKPLERLADALVVGSRKIAALRQQAFGWEPDIRKFAAVPIGISIRDDPLAARARNRQHVRRDLGIGADMLVIGCVVRLAPRKGIDDLLRAFSLVRRDLPCKLVLVGDGPLRRELQILADELRIQDDVIFAGFHADPTPLLDAMDIFALAVPSGTGSIALMEAMARALPSVITFGGPEEAVISEETGLCAPPHDPRALADALRRLASDADLRRRLGASAATHIRRHFSIRRAADDMLDLYAAARHGEVPSRLRMNNLPHQRSRVEATAT